jgi:hypothetical protein
MDLGAYVQIEDIEQIAKDNGIEVPRLRGYRLMKDEEYIDYSDMFEDIDIDSVKALCESVPFWSMYPRYSESWEYTDYLKHLFLEYKDNKPIRVRWERIHGWKRKTLKLAIHNRKKRIKAQYDMWNKYVGREDILYIHSRIGGNNWPIYAHDVLGKPWFIERVDDSFDSTYCDIYARIK